MSITGVNHITLAVTDLQKSLWFYADVLGGQLRADWNGGAYLELGTLWLCLMRSDVPVEPRTDYTHIALSCQAKDFPILTQKISVHTQLWQTNSSEGTSLYFLDPDGHQLELHQGDLHSRLAHYRDHPEKNVRLHD